MSCKLPYGESCGLLRGVSRKRKPLIWASAREVWKWMVLCAYVLALPDAIICRVVSGRCCRCHGPCCCLLVHCCHGPVLLLRVLLLERCC